MTSSAPLLKVTTTSVTLDPRLNLSSLRLFTHETGAITVFCQGPL